MYLIKQSTALTVPFFAHDASGDGVTGLVDGGFTKRISKGSGAYGAMTVTITEMENGWYSFPLSTSHSDTLGLLSLSFSHASIKRANLQWRVEVNLLDSVSVDIASIKTDTGTTIPARIPAALTGAGNMKADILAINGNTTAAAVLAILNGVTVVYQGTVTGAATTTTLIDSGLTQADTDHWKGRILIFTSGALTLQATDCTAFDAATDKVTFTALTQAPGAGGSYVII